MSGYNLRRAIARAALIALPMQAAAAANAQRICAVDAVDAVRHAREAGFIFRVLAMDATRCELAESTLVVSAPQGRAVSCRFLLFGGRQLAGGWRQDRLQLSASAGARVGVATPQSGRGWILTIVSPRATTSLVSVRSVVVRGRNCAEALRAFD